MKRLASSLFVLALAGAVSAEQFDIGVAGGIGIYRDATLTRNSDSGKAGFQTGPVLGVFVTHNLYRHLAGQIRYTYQFNDLEVSAAGTEATFSGLSHAIHYDLLFLPGGEDSPIRPYLAGGGGVKVYKGTGTEHATQTLGQYAALSKTQEVKPLATFGGGLRMKAGHRTHFYVEVRDYLTPFPRQVVAPVPPSKIKGWLHDIVPMAGVSVGF